MASDDPQVYRRRIKTQGLVGFSVRVAQTDLYVRAVRDLSEIAFELALDGRNRIFGWIESHPDFLTSLNPLPQSPAAMTPVKEMLAAGLAAGVGPMAAVAGALAEFVGQGLLEYSPGGVVVENGGDVFVAAGRSVTVGLYAGDSNLSMRFGVHIPPDLQPVGICTSSATVGHSLSLGQADAAMVLAKSTSLADALATALGNRIKTADNLEPALNWVREIPGVIGAVGIVKDRFGLVGPLDLVAL